MIVRVVLINEVRAFLQATKNNYETLGENTTKKFEDDLTTFSCGASWLKFSVYFNNIFLNPK